MEQKYQVEKKDKGQRLDVWCTQRMPQFSRAAIQRAIKTGHILVNGNPAKPRYAVKDRDLVLLAMTEEISNLTDQTEESEKLLKPTIIFEDKDLLAINKPAGMATHPGIGTRTGTTVSEWFVAKYPEVEQIGDQGRPGIVHRLDKQTSGILILAKTSVAYEEFKKQFKERLVHKEYLALIFGSLKEGQGEIRQAIARSHRNPVRRTVDPAGKWAQTIWQVVETFQDKYSLLKLLPSTGRMHQLRVHLHWLGHPIVGDSLYTMKRQRSPKGVKRQLLHAERLTLKMVGGKEQVFVCSLPQDFNEVLDQLRDEQNNSSVHDLR